MPQRLVWVISQIECLIEILLVAGNGARPLVCEGMEQVSSSGNGQFMFHTCSGFMNCHQI